MGVSERSKQAAFVGFLPKPFDLSFLVETVARVVENPAVVRELLRIGPAAGLNSQLRGAYQVAFGARPSVPTTVTGKDGSGGAAA